MLLCRPSQPHLIDRRMVKKRNKPSSAPVPERYRKRKKQTYHRDLQPTIAAQIHFCTPRMICIRSLSLARRKTARSRAQS